MLTVIIILLVAMSFAYYMNQRLRIRRETEHEKRMERFEKLMDNLKAVREKEEPENKNDKHES